MPRTYVVDGSKEIRLEELDPGHTGSLKRAEGEELLVQQGEKLTELLDLLFYAGKHALLVILQGMDTSGKDGAIRRILRYSNAQSLRVEPFKVPTDEELAHDFLWRIHARAPARGHATIFNRSHYEDVVVVRVHDLVPKSVWRRRFEQINQFEALLASNDTLILKFFLHISKKEQEERLLAREQEVEKAWKLSAGDWREREHWDAYQAAYEDAINRCAAPEAPWHVVPADHKWYRDVAILERLVETLEPCRQEWLEHLAGIGEKAKAELREYRAGAGAK